MTINQTLDKFEDYIAGILPAFMMLGITVFIILGLGACVTPASALSESDFVFYPYPDCDMYYYSSSSQIVSSDRTLSKVYIDGVQQTDKVIIPSGTEMFSIQYRTNCSYADFNSLYASGLMSYISGLSSANPGFALLLSGGNTGSCAAVVVAYYKLTDSGDDSGNTDTGGDSGDDSGNVDTGGDGGDDLDFNWGDKSLMDGFKFTPPVYGEGKSYVGNGQWINSIWGASTTSEIRSYIGGIMGSSWLRNCDFYYCGEEIPLSAIRYWNCSTWYSSIEWVFPDDVPEDYQAQYLCELSKANPDYIVYYRPNTETRVFAAHYVGAHYDSSLPFDFDITYDKDSDTYDVSLKRNGEPWYLSIKGKAFGWIPVYTYTTVQDESLDLSLSGLPSRFFTFDIDYTADVYRLGSGAEIEDNPVLGQCYFYSWTRADFINEEGVVTDPDIPPEQGNTTVVDPLVPNPPVTGGLGGYDTPGIEDIDHDGIHNSEDDDMDGDGTPNEEDDEPYNPYNNGILGSLGFTPNVSLPDIESITDMMRNMKLPASFKEMFNIPLPDEYKAGIAVEEGHVFYGYQQLWFGLGDGVIGLFMGIILVIAALIACIPRFLFEFFSSLIEWLNVAFQSFYDWLVIPSEIFKLVIGLLPDELLAIALLLFGIDLVFLFFRFVIPGLISGSRAVGDIAQKEEEILSYEDENHGKRRYK